jgi:hypothetical protein
VVWLRRPSPGRQYSNTTSAPPTNNESKKTFGAEFTPAEDTPPALTTQDFLTGKTRCNQVKFRGDCNSALSRRFF